MGTNSYSVPWRLIGERVRVAVGTGTVRISCAGWVVAMHEERAGRRERAVDPAPFEGVAGFPARVAGDGVGPAPPPPQSPALLRPLSEYEAVAGGAW